MKCVALTSDVEEVSYGHGGHGRDDNMGVGTSANTKLTTDHLLAPTQDVFISALLASDWLNTPELGSDWLLMISMSLMTGWSPLSIRSPPARYITARCSEPLRCD